MAQPAKTKTIFVCSNCGNEFLAWQGQCSACGQWNTIKEIRISKSEIRKERKNQIGEISPVILKDVRVDDHARINSGMAEFDRVLGGGVVPGSIGLVGGDPGIGKSTLLLQIAHEIPNILYISGEESAEQIAMRVQRLGLTGQLQFLAETDSDRIAEIIEDRKPEVVIIDSIQTMYDQSFPSTPGSIVQVRETALRFQQIAKQSKTAIILVGHVTKEGTVAGPRILEHMIDYLLYLEGDRQQDLRILRAVKNRFGSTDEVGVFQMTELGFKQVVNPSVLFIGNRGNNSQAGSIITVTIQGNRPFLVEIQALTSKTVFGYPKRTASGVDLNRLQLMSVILQKRLGVRLDAHDIYVSSIGGMSVKEPAIDLPMSLAILSAFAMKPIQGWVAAVGELDLVGRVRSVIRQKLRVEEGRRLGYDVIGPDKYTDIATMARDLNLIT